MSECTHDCSTCGESCASREPQSLLKAHHPEAHVGKVYGIVSGKGVTATAGSKKSSAPEVA